jgi:hypothetical protein
MIKKILMPILSLGIVLLVQCTDDPITPDQELYKSGGGSGNGGGGNGGGGNGGGGGGGIEPAGNNLSFPVIAADGYTITHLASPSFLVTYSGEYPGLTEEEITWLEENGPWYPQKVESNLWQAEYRNSNADVHVSFIDWGDLIEVVNPKKNRPFRLEVTLYVNIADDPMDGYVMALLGSPSSQDEVQGTNAMTYSGIWATVVSASPKLIVQSMDDNSSPVWNPNTKMWEGDGIGLPESGFGFAPELNVGGKYIYGASQGGWKPMALGDYRITFYMSSNNSFIHLEDAQIGNYPGNIPEIMPSENSAAIPVVDIVNNLTYVDVTVVSGGGGGGGNH